MEKRFKWGGKGGGDPDRLLLMLMLMLMLMGIEQEEGGGWLSLSIVCADYILGWDFIERGDQGINQEPHGHGHAFFV